MMPAAIFDPYQHTQDHTQRYRYWRIRIMYSMMIGYAGFYLARQNLSMAIPAIQAELGYSKVQIGIIMTLSAIIYGVGKGIMGLMSDRNNARYFMAFGLFMSSIMNLFMGLSSSLMCFIIFWSLNSCFQSMGWPPCARMLTHWFSPKEIGTKWALWNTSQQIGGAVILIFGGWIIGHYGWRFVFFMPSLIGIGLSFILINRLRDTPHSVGLPPIEEHHGLVPKGVIQYDDRLSTRQILFEKILINKFIWYLCIANFFIYIVRMSVFNWGPTFLKEFKGYSLSLAGWQTGIYDLAGMFGGLVAGYCSDHFFNGYRSRVGAIFMMVLGFFLVLLWLTPPGSLILDFLIMTAIGFLVSGPQILVGVAAADFASKKAAGTASGLTGTVGYIGAAVTGVGVGAIVDYYGWSYAFILIIIASFLSAVCFCLMWNHRSNILNKHHNSL